MKKLSSMIVVLALLGANLAVAQGQPVNRFIEVTVSSAFTTSTGEAVTSHLS